MSFATTRAVAGYGLSGAPLALPRGSLDERTWTVVLADAAREHVTGHLVQALDDGAFPATDTQWAEAIEHHERALGLDLVLERLLLASVAELDAAGIPTRVLKGPAVAHTVYPEPGRRSFADVDLLVPAQHYDGAIGLLCRDGARRRYPEPRRGFDRRFGKGVCLESRDGLELDLHRTFVAGPFGLAVDNEALFATSWPFSLGGRVLEGLDPEARFVHACFHASLGDVEPRLVALRDVAQMLLHSTLDAHRVQELCRRWRCGIVVQRATQVAWETFGIAVSPELVRWAQHYLPSEFERRALRAYVGPDRSYARQAVAGLYAVRGIRAKAAYAGALLVPTAAYVRARDGSYLRRVGRAVGMFLGERAKRARRRPDT
jgi:hypothetical protein